MGKRVLGYATQLCHEEMGSSGNYVVRGCFEPGSVTEDDDMHDEISTTSTKRRLKSWTPFLVHMEEKICKRRALEMAPPEDRALLAKKQAVSNVHDCNRRDNKAKDRRKCGICGHVGHNRATCPNMAPANAMQNLPSAPVHADRERGD
eukprot:jgi/Tetstr1/424947/TSEL_015440.t1